ncbi:hypothetical protein [Modestobacter sp. VKM Ac-2985]|uniref:hypothetical protein n=1 Tax=Modestobacter sp. VKM Ac-2985 TaxID=3004139 RepID=UPI0022ABA7B4|nr:hypothetical protein [Modestobacter sp. VKM Ac-2985]MCZ2839137.1 hypothetical protein [Modestobacter sp. VKM Ac-2985]
MEERPPLPPAEAWRAVARCVLRCGVLLAQRRLRLPRRHVGLRLRFADGTTGTVYRETRVDRLAPVDPCLLVVEFRLRGVHGPRAHALFRAESLLNTPLFAGFPGLVSKFWVAADEHDVYRGVYEWDGPDRAEAYARALWRVLALVSVPGSIHHCVVPGLRRAQVLADPGLLGAGTPGGRADWWRLVDAG